MVKSAEIKKVSKSWNSMLCSTFEKKLASNMESSRIMKLIRLNEFVFEVLSLDQIFCVDGSRFSCSCNPRQIQGFSCFHIVASISSPRGSLYD